MLALLQRKIPCGPSDFLPGHPGQLVKERAFIVYRSVIQLRFITVHVRRRFNCSCASAAEAVFLFARELNCYASPSNWRLLSEACEEV